VTEWRVLAHPAVVQEIDDAALYYENSQPNLGGDFADAVAKTIRQLYGYPKAYSEYMRGWRRIVTDTFPYLMVYAIRGKTVYVATLQHGRRNPAVIKKTVRSRPIRGGEYRPLNGQQRSGAGISN